MTTNTNQTKPKRYRVRWERILRTGLREHGSIEPVTYVASVVDHTLTKEDRHSVRRAARKLVAAGVAARDGERIVWVEHKPEPVDQTPRWINEPAERTMTTVPCPQCRGTGQTLRGHVCAGCGGAASVPKLPTWQGSGGKRPFEYHPFNETTVGTAEESRQVKVEKLPGPEQWELDADADRTSSYPGMDTAPRVEAGQKKEERCTMPPGQIALLPGEGDIADEVIARVDNDEDKLRAEAHELGKRQGLTPEQVDDLLYPHGRLDAEQPV